MNVEVGGAAQIAAVHMRLPGEVCRVCGGDKRMAVVAPVDDVVDCPHCGPEQMSVLVTMIPVRRFDGE